MYIVGSKVVHPCHGAGTIVRIQQKSIGATEHTYYIIHTVGKPMQVMVPVRSADQLGLRDVGEQGDLRTKLAACRERPAADEINSDFRARQLALNEQLKSGRFELVTCAVRTLHFLNAQRPLGMMDRQLLDAGKQILASELALASDLDIEAAMAEIDTSLARMFDGPECD